MAAIDAYGATAHIPARATSRWPKPVDRTIYRERNRIDRLLSDIKHFIGIAARHFKAVANALAALHLACFRLWIKANKSTT
ncbi:hypothetical protein KY389_10625 [Paracoccus bogoriensis]|nr:hypothetical protein [Paracoccus bogoriensis]